MINKNIDDIKNFIGVNKGFSFDEISPYGKRAINKFLIPYVGEAQYKTFEDYSDSDEVVLKAKEFAAAAEANFAYYLYLPIASVQISTGGIFVAENESSRSASDKHLKELQRSFKTAGHESLDLLLSAMSASSDKFTDWTTTDSYKRFSNLLVNSTKEFNDCYNIFNSHQTFFALIPSLITSEIQYLLPVFGEQLLTAIKTGQNNDNREKVKQYIKRALVAFTVSKVVYEGLFVLNAEGMYVRFDVLPYEKVNTNVNLKINDFLKHTEKSKRTEGEEYLKLALTIIKDNSSDFTEYTAPEESTRELNIKETPGIIGI